MRTTNKYHNIKSIYNGVVYDSRKEAKRAFELNMLQRANEISNLQRQVKFELQPAYTTKDGRKIQAIFYVADFVYKINGIQVVEDVKGVRTEVYRLKRKLFEYKYKDYKFIET